MNLSVLVLVVRFQFLAFGVLSLVMMHTATRANAQDPAALVDYYAPQLMHPHDEPNLPTNVDWFLSKTALSFHSAGCDQDNKNFGTPTLEILQTASVKSSCGGHVYMASGTRSARRSKTFILRDVSDSDKRGSLNTSDWVTYYHAYKNDQGGTTIQYWTFYAFNTGIRISKPPLPPIEIGYHGGDWEMVAVVLDAANIPISLTTTGHTDMESVPWSAVQKNGTHPILYTERGGHEVHPHPQGSGPYIVHQTWAGSKVSGLSATDTLSGALYNLGTKLHPLAKFVTYSGLWGSLGAVDISSGYWGPVFNETGMRPDGFFSAWCAGAANPNASENEKKECYPDDPQ